MPRAAFDSGTFNLVTVYAITKLSLLDKIHKIKKEI